MRALGFPLIGVLIGVAASFTGLGGGFLVVPILMAMGFSAQRAVGTSFVAILVLSLSALVGHAQLRDVDWRVGVLLGLGGVAGAQVGPRLLQHVSGAAFHKVFAGVLLALAAWMFFRK